MSILAQTLPQRRAARLDWTPYLVGAGIGVLSWAAFVFANAPLGITTALSQVSGGVAATIFGADFVAKNAYWMKAMPALDYGTIFLAGTLLGGLISAGVSGRWKLEMVPAAWADRFGASPMRRGLAAFAGGALAMFGARLANGCTSGNGISGGLQLALSGWVFLAVMFPVGIATAFLMFGRRK